MKNSIYVLTSVCIIVFVVMSANSYASNVGLTEKDFAEIRACIDRYESAYSAKDIKGMIECCDKDSEWFNGLEEAMQKEFKRYEYIRIKSKETKLKRDPKGKKEDDLMTIRRELYIAYIDSEASSVRGRQNNSADINEYDGVYCISRSPKDNRWKIRMFGQMTCDEQMTYLKGKQLVRAGKIQDAIAKFSEAISINPSYSPAYSTLSDLAFATGKLPESINYATQTVKLQPDVAYYHYSLGMLYLYAKNKEKGVEELKEAKKLDKEFPDIDYFINNADKVIAVSDHVLNNFSMNEDSAKIISIDTEDYDGGVKIKDLNLMIAKPKEWVLVPQTDWRTIFAISTVNNPSLTDPIIIVSIRPIPDNKDAKEICYDIARNIAVEFRNKVITKISASKEITIAGLHATEIRFAFSNKLEPVVAIITTFIKNKIAYSIIYSDKAKDMKIDEQPYKDVIAGVQFIDPKGDISPEIVETLIAAEKKR